ncbi:MAG: ATP-binding cassette domain-containing protein [Ruminococcaceae bacterium]|nr:ATP-binding cassette domain-containing protein [Oscillospiraceae bacterium]
MIGFIPYLTVFALVALMLLGAYQIRKKGYELSKFTRPAAIVLFAVMCIRYLWNANSIALFETRALDMFSPFGDSAMLKTLIAVLLIWFSYAAMFAVVFSEFYNYKTLRHMANFFSVPVFLLVLVFFKIYVIGSYTEAGYTLSDIRVWGVMVEIALGIAIPASRVLVESKFPVPTRIETKSFIAILPFAVLAIMPCYVPQAIFGYVADNIRVQGVNQIHRFVIYGAIIVPFLIFHAFKDKPEDVKRMAMLYLSLSLLWSYMAYRDLVGMTDEGLTGWIVPTNLPLHLCNTAMFIIPLCLAFRLNKVFYFTLFINVLGAFIAMIVPNTESTVNALGAVRIHFWINHYPAFFMPILLIALKLFERPKFKQWLYSQAAFAVYFVFILIFNAWFTNYDSGVDFFFLNSDFIVEKLGKWAEDTRDLAVSFNIKDLTFTFYPVYQAIFYFVYVAVSAGMWFLYALLFTTWDAAEDRRLKERDYKDMKKKLNEFLGGRAASEPATGDNSPKLVLREFSKKYGANKHYSVDHVSLEVNGGEVFGFLGPNGAGKSTIIKSVVGIQTITSGDIEICGYNVQMQPVEAKLHTGFVPDHYALYENLTGREYINYIADLFEVKRKYRDEIIEKYVERFQLTGSFDNQMKTYSHGMKQKITIMAALVHNPAVWILDEPLTGLDPTSIHEVKECMKEHAAQGNIVFFSSHIIDVVEKICDRIAIIKKGKLRACVTLKELEEKGIDLEQFYLSIINAESDEATEAVVRAAVSGEVAEA